MGQVYKRTHGRCKGTGGFELANGNVVPCAGCSARGYLVVYTAAEKAANQAAWDRRNAALDAIKKRAATMAADMPGSAGAIFPQVVKAGFSQLEGREPERLEKLYESIDTGRIDDVVRALYRYRKPAD